MREVVGVGTPVQLLQMMIRHLGANPQPLGHGSDGGTRALGEAGELLENSQLSFRSWGRILVVAGPAACKSPVRSRVLAEGERS